MDGWTVEHLGTTCTASLPASLLRLFPTQDEYPEAERFTASVFPSSETDDVVTSPFNALLSLAKLAEHATAVLPLDNAALAAAAAAVEGRRGGRAGAGAGAAGGKGWGWRGVGWGGVRGPMHGAR